MSERINRRAFFVRTVAGGAGAAVAAVGLPARLEQYLPVLGGAIQRVARAFEARVALAEPAFPSWQPSLNAQPEAQAAMVPWTVKFDSGKTAEVIGGPIRYKDPDGKEINFLGQSDGGNRISVVLIKDGTPGIQMVAWGAGNWEGITDNPNNTNLTSSGENALVVDAYNAVTNPANGNGKNHDGKFDRIDFAVIDGPIGKIVKRGQIVKDVGGEITTILDFDLEVPQPIQAPAQPTQQPTSTGESSQPGFVSNSGQGETQTAQGLGEHSFDLQPGQQIRVSKGTIIRGEFMFRDPNTGQWMVKYDSDGQTGLVSIIDQDVDVMTNYPVGVVENVSGDIDARANAFAAEQSINGCQNGQGCSKGVFIAHVPEGPFQRN